MSKPIATTASVTKSNAAADRISRQGLTFRERQKLGLDLGSIITAARKLKEAGEIDKDTTEAEAAAMLLGEFQGNDTAIDIERILRWFELIMPIILKLLKL